jgi:ribonuclease P/MRP protein subunit RPP1
MNFYDFHIHSSFSEGESTVEEIAQRAKFLGFKGICFVQYFKDRSQISHLKEKISKISKETNLEIFIGLEAKNPEELNRLIDMRRDYDILLVQGSDIDLNRKAVQAKEVDILTHPEFNRKDHGFNHVMARLSSSNKVAIEINFREILLSSKNRRSMIMHNISENVKLCKKFRVPIIICSGAISYWQLKDPKILLSMGCILGLDLNEAKKALSETPEKIIKMIKERHDSKWIRPGVKVIE